MASFVIISIRNNARAPAVIPEVEPVITDFMSDMATNNLHGAYAHLSSRATSLVTPVVFGEFLKGANFRDYEGFQSLTVDSVRITTLFNTDLFSSQGTRATAIATVSYHGGWTGSLSAILVQEDGHWKIDAFDVLPEPDKP